MMLSKKIDYETFYSLALSLVKDGKAHQIEPPVFPAEIIQKLKNDLRIENAVETNAAILADKEDTYWYHPKFFGQDHWPRHKEHLLEVKAWPADAVDSIDETTTQIMKQLCPSTNESFQIAGLVLGHIQSGKTANYTALMAKAADAGYNFFIVMSGIHNNLRRQTQNRLDMDLTGNSRNPDLSVKQPPIGKRWESLTTEDDDFSKTVDPNTLQHDSPKIMVIKKNCLVLEKVVEWLNKADVELLDSKKVMIIDDEADQATINIKITLDTDAYDLSEEELNEELEVDASRTNELVRSIRNKFKCNIYIGYTATPFANVLIEPFDVDLILGPTLYPKDFIISLPKPKGYIGTEELFQDNPEEFSRMSPIHIIPENDADIMLNGCIDSRFNLPESISDALISFLITGILKEIQGVDNKHHTMLIHSHHMIEIHQSIFRRVSDLWTDMQSEFTYPSRYDKNNAQIFLLKEHWQKYGEFYKGENGIELKEILAYLPDFIKRVKLLQINSDSKDELDYEEHPNGLKAIVIGGNRLSRGLTLEGLTISYFTRSSMMYDTLLQMGRWFGFRQGYEDLVRIYTTPQLYDWFSWLCEVERAIRDDINRYDELNKRPDELAVRVKTHPAMLVTSPLKMKNAEEYRVGFDGQRLETLYFDFNRPDLLKDNLNLTFQLIDQLLCNDFAKHKDGVLWKNVSCDMVIQFLQNFETPQSNIGTFKKDIIIDYIKKQYERHNELTSWSVLLASSSKAKNTMEIKEIKIGLPMRSKEKGNNKISLLSDPRHFSIDLPGSLDDYKDPLTKKPSFTKMLDKRNSNNALLILYIIDKDSDTWKLAPDSKEPLFNEGCEKVDCTGMTIIFPLSGTAEKDNYIKAGGLPSELD